jgi:hypothetical protein
MMKKYSLHGVKLAVVMALSLMFSACFGIKSDISVRKDGSGVIALEYRISEELLKLGTQDGNEQFPALPVGEEDYKRTIDRIEGLKLSAFSSKKEMNDIVYAVRLEYAKLSALIEFMDTQGEHFTLTEKDGETLLDIVFAPGGEVETAEIKELLPVIFGNYRFDYKMSFPQKCNVRFFDAGRNAIDKPPAGVCTIDGVSFTFSSAMSELLSVNANFVMQIRW